MQNRPQEEEAAKEYDKQIAEDLGRLDGQEKDDALSHILRHPDLSQNMAMSIFSENSAIMFADIVPQRRDINTSAYKAKRKKCLEVLECLSDKPDILHAVLLQPVTERVRRGTIMHDFGVTGDPDIWKKLLSTFKGDKDKILSLVDCSNEEAFDVSVMHMLGKYGHERLIGIIKDTVGRSGASDFNALMNRYNGYLRKTPQELLSRYLYDNSIVMPSFHI